MKFLHFVTAFFCIIYFSDSFKGLFAVHRFKVHFPAVDLYVPLSSTNSSFALRCASYRSRYGTVAVNLVSLISVITQEVVSHIFLPSDTASVFS